LARLFKLAVWDAEYFATHSGGGLAAGPAKVMYGVYPRLSPAPVTLAPLTAEQSQALDQGSLPSELVPIICGAKTTMNLTSRP
jgi:hypothetical protein